MACDAQALAHTIGFPRGAKPREVDPTVVRNLGLVYSPAIILLYVGTLAFLSVYRISRATREANLEQFARGRGGGRREQLSATSLSDG